MYAFLMTLGGLTLDQIENLEDGEIDLKELSSAVDRLQIKFCRVVAHGKRNGDHLLPGMSAVGWAAGTCGMSRNAASNRLCVGEQIDSLPKISEAIRSGRVSYQSAAVICHLREQLREEAGELNEEDWVGFAQKFPVKELNDLARITRHVVDPDGFLKDENENFSSGVC